MAQAKVFLEYQVWEWLHALRGTLSINHLNNAIFPQNSVPVC